MQEGLGHMPMPRCFERGRDRKPWEQFGFATPLRGGEIIKRPSRERPLLFVPKKPRSIAREDSKKYCGAGEMMWISRISHYALTVFSLSSVSQSKGSRLKAGTATPRLHPAIRWTEVAFEPLQRGAQRLPMRHESVRAGAQIILHRPSAEPVEAIEPSLPFRRQARQNRLQ
jgi:hypothetical protein